METRKKRFGDRYDGRQLRTVDTMYKMAPYIMRSKYDATNYYTDTVEITEIKQFLKKKRAEGYPGMGMLHVLLASYVRAVSQKPELNRFIAGQKIYARYEVDIVMMVKQKMTEKASETSVKIRLDRKDTISDIYRKVNTVIDKVKDEQSQSGAFDIADVLVKLPRFLNRFVFWTMRTLDYYGLLPKFLIDESLFHGSVFLTDLGSLGIQPVAHHIYDFGNIPFFVSFGAKRRVNELQLDGTVQEKCYVDYILSIDDRITDGFYCAQIIKRFKSFVRNPAQLDVAPESIVEDVD